MSTQSNSFAEEIADYLGETDDTVRGRIAQIVQLCGEDFVRDLMLQTVKIQAQGGLPTTDNSRQRTIGGVHHGHMGFPVSRQLARGGQARPGLHCS